MTSFSFSFLLTIFIFCGFLTWGLIYIFNVNKTFYKLDYDFFYNEGEFDLIAATTALNLPYNKFVFITPKFIKNNELGQVIDLFIHEYKSTQDEKIKNLVLFCLKKYYSNSQTPFQMLKRLDIEYISKLNSKLRLELYPIYMEHFIKYRKIVHQNREQINSYIFNKNNANSNKIKQKMDLLTSDKTSEHLSYYVLNRISQNLKIAKRNDHELLNYIYQLQLDLFNNKVIKEFFIPEYSSVINTFLSENPLTMKKKINDF